MSGFLESLFPSIAKGRLLSFYSFDRHYRGETPFGFVAPYRLHGHVKVVNEDQFFEATRHSTQGAQGVVDELVDIFHDGIFLSLIEQHRLFFHYHWNQYHYILLGFWEYAERDDGISVDWSLYYKTGGIGESADKAIKGFRRYGCAIQVLLVDFEPSQTEAIMENMSMIRPKVLAAIRESGLHLEMVEQFCIAALAERRALFHDPKSYSGGAVTIRTQIVGDALKLSWEHPRAGQGWQLLGFRKTGGFGPDAASETQNGILVVDSIHSKGETVEAALPRNEPLYYTFFLKKQEKEQKFFEEGKTFFRYEPVARFTVNIPDEDTVQALVKQLEETRLKAQIAEAERKAAEVKKGKPSFADERLAMVDSQLRLAPEIDQRLALVDQWERAALQDAEKRAEHYTPDEMEWRRDDIRDRYAKVRENVRRLV